MGIDPSLTCTAIVSIITSSSGESVSKRLCRTEKKKFTCHAARIDALRNMLLGEITQNNLPALIALEGYSFGSKGDAIYKISEWGGLLRWTLWGELLTFIEVPPATLKLFVAGKGNADKEAMIAAVKRRWQYEPEDDNDADAFGLARLAEAYAKGPGSAEHQILEGKVRLVRG